MGLEIIDCFSDSDTETNVDKASTISRTTANIPSIIPHLKEIDAIKYDRLLDRRGVGPSPGNHAKGTNETPSPTRHEPRTRAGDETGTFTCRGRKRKGAIVLPKLKDQKSKADVPATESLAGRTEKAKHTVIIVKTSTSAGEETLDVTANGVASNGAECYTDASIRAAKASTLAGGAAVQMSGPGVTTPIAWAFSKSNATGHAADDAETHSAVRGRVVAAMATGISENAAYCSADASDVAAIPPVSSATAADKVAAVLGIYKYGTAVPSSLGSNQSVDRISNSAVAGRRDQRRAGVDQVRHLAVTVKGSCASIATALAVNKPFSTTGGRHFLRVRFMLQKGGDLANQNSTQNDNFIDY